MNPYGMFMPNMGYGMPGMMGRSFGMMRGLGKGAFKSVNWGNLFNNASKALGVVNQTIPLVKGAGPMINNMKSMLKLASMFKDETDTKSDNVTSNNDSNSNNNSSNIEEIKKEEINNYSNYSSNYNNPNFFL